MILKRQNTFEVFGLDFMVDEHFNCWLIEVNKSPAMEYSTDTTERMSKQLQRDTAALVDMFYVKQGVTMLNRKKSNSQSQ